ncbi:MAG: hypothetical protein GX100_06600 [candidate division WS1 bacterium]|nr:hypothetical protein [candidate division WS1 bacterium]
MILHASTGGLQGLPADWQERNLFGFDPPDSVPPLSLDLGWVDSPLCLAFEWQVLEETKSYQVVQDHSGRIKRIFRDLPTLAMLTYLRHAVTSSRPVLAPGGLALRELSPFAPAY